MTDDLKAGLQMLAEARACLTAGRIDRADEIGRRILALDLENAEAKYIVGLVAHLRGATDEAIEYLRQAAAADRRQPQYHYNLGVLLQTQGLAAEALACYRAAMELEPGSPQTHNNLGYVLFKSGELDEALACLQNAIRLDPELAEAHNNLGLVLAARGEIEPAVRSYRRAVRIRPNLTEAHYNLGMSLSALGKEYAAVDCYRKTLELHPAHKEASRALALLLTKLGEGDAVEALEHAASILPDDAALADEVGSAYARLKQPEKAVEWYRTAVRLQPGSAAYHNNLGVALKDLERFDEAIEAYERALSLCPDLAETHANIGRVYAQQGRHEDARIAFEQALQIDRQHAGARCGLAHALIQLRRCEDAVDMIREMLEERSDNVTAHTLLGNAYTEMKRYAEAEDAYRCAIAADPTEPVAHSNLANLLTLSGRPDLGEPEARLALALKPEYPDALHNRAIALGALGRTDEAMAVRRQALKLKVDFPEAELAVSYELLRQENFPEGWPLYESRWKLRQYVKPVFEQPEWDGSPPAGRTIVLYAEQGLGDTLQFIRYAPLLKQRGAQVVFICQKALANLLRTAPGIDCLVPSGEPLPRFDVQLPLLSLPRALGTTMDTIPDGVPYLSADPALVEHWQRELARLEGFRIAISWQGNRDYVGDTLRSFPLRHLEAVAQVPGVRLLSLQKGFGRDQVAEIAGRFDVVDLADQLDVSSGAFMDTAAVMKCVDLVITSDSAMAHLAGALGVPTWLAVSLSPDWRWLEGREDSPWYPSMRLFRQRRLKGWDEVFERMAEELEKLLERRRGTFSTGCCAPATPGAASNNHRWSKYAPAVSVITPWLDHPELIADYERAVRGAQVIIVDNGSGPQAAAEIRAMVDRLEGVYLRNEHNVGFAAANNQGLAQAVGDIVIFLNNDITAGPEFLERVRSDVKPDTLAGPALKVQTVYGLRLRYLDGWCVAGYRQAFDRLNGWDSATFAEPFWEDNDLCFRATQAGLVLRQFPWPVEHKGGVTHGLLACWGDVFERNRAHFAERVRPFYLQKLAAATAAAGERLPIVATSKDRAPAERGTSSAARVNLTCAVSNVGYGVVGLNVLKSLTKAGAMVACWPLGAFEPPLDDAELVQLAMRRQATQRDSAPSLRIFHQTQLKEHVGRPYIGFPIFELDRFTADEIEHLRFQDRLLVASQWARHVVEANRVFNDCERVRVVPLGVDRKTFHESTVDDGVGANGTTTVFLAVGKWELRKGHDLLLKAFSQAFLPDDDVELWLLAESPVALSSMKSAAAFKQEWEPLYRSSALRNKIKLLSWQATQGEVAHVMRQADCGVFLSRAEGWNLPALEMLSCGKHIVLTNYSGHTEFCDPSNARLVEIDQLEDASDGCWFFGQGQWAALGERQLEQAVEHLRQVHRAKQEGRLMVNQSGIETARRFSWDACAARILDVLASF